MPNHDYDYIIAGGGLAGLSLAYRMIHSTLADKNILLVDQSLASVNDKTWSFWHKGRPPFEHLVSKSWEKAEIVFNDHSFVKPLDTYTYHSIRSGTFQTAILDELHRHPAVDLLESTIVSMEGNESKATLGTGSNTFTASYIFQSCLPPPTAEHDAPHYPLIQHFLGWEVETSKKIFDPSTVTLMDFDPNFSEGIGFIYILPSAPGKALLEYTVFSDQVKPRPFYEEKLSIYLHNKFGLRPLDFSIARKEYGEIPMQDYPYTPWYAQRVLNLGMVGGLTKPSTGYTFSRIQRHTEALINCLIEQQEPALPYRSAFRYRAYDLWLLQIIHEDPRTALHIFQQLFSNNTMDEVFHFLAEENSLLQDFKTMSRVSYAPFFRAMWKTRKRLFEI